jgi:hypothetical protein
MTRKKTWLGTVVAWTATTVLVVAVGFAAARHLYFSAGAESDLDVRPYVMQQVSFNSSTGTEKILERRTESRRRDGSIHRAGTLYRSDGTEVTTIRRVDLADGLIGMIADAIRSKATGRIGRRRLAAQKEFMKNPPPDCLSQGYALEGEETLFGHRAIRLSRRTAPESLERELAWALPDFNCVIVQGYTEQRPNLGGAWTTVYGLRLISFVEIDPDEDVFRNWARYEEMKPTDLKRRLAEQAGLTPQACPSCFTPEPSDVEYALANRRN